VTAEHGGDQPTPDKADESDVDGSRMPFVEHLRELRRRLLYCVIFVFVASIATFTWSEELFVWITEPLRQVSGQRMQVLGLIEMFMTYLKLSVLAALFVGAPYILLQAWLFVAPGLYRHEKRWIGPFILLGTLFFVGGAAFAFYVVLPLGFSQLVLMVPDGIEANFRVEDYVSFVVGMLLAFGLVFELPLVMWIMSAAGVVSPQGWAKLRRYWLIIAFVIGAILTPPDVLSQVAMSIPLVVFFELGVLGARFLYRRRDPVKAAASPAG
jgi:sec-independent protein translocase protein TatC